MSSQHTNSISISVETSYIEAESVPSENRYVFSYTISIRNLGTQPARLLNRHWIITDANGRVQEVRGEGVVGQQPYLRPGQMFRYTSGTMITTPVGSMHGSYEMLNDEGVRFEAEIAPFSLSIPKTLH